MDHSNSIAPFPSDIDRETFGPWLSGFTDGEGCFQIWTARVRRWSRGGASFTIALRADDGAILELIQSFLGCGKIHRKPGRTCTCRSGKLSVINPQHFFRVDSLSSLTDVVAPHFERFPLLAKKRHDFAIWKQGVAILRRIATRKRCGRGMGRGTAPKWTLPEWNEFVELVAALKEVRRFKPEAI
jgi:hypothetical protein